MSNISILVSCHKPVEVVPSEIIKPIQVGCALNEKRFKGMLRDNERSEERRVGKECRSRWSPYH